MRKNCWEFKGCGREPGGSRTGESGVCPVSTEASLDGVHAGTNAGRACWVVAGTSCACKEKADDDFFTKYSVCAECEFYNRVRAEEGKGFIIVPHLLRMLKARIYMADKTDFNELKNVLTHDGHPDSFK
ncbi:MAG: hypothetical protein EPN94_03655 [Nitrospirae bacterium]|nr:MAG: hypothetical protein EPN94_03655 [Nitrospirota bacterium]